MAADEAEPGALNTLISQGRDYEIVEVDKSGNLLHKWRHTKDGRVSKVGMALIFPNPPSRADRLMGFNKLAAPKDTDGSFSRLFRECFLPAGFPHSVSEDYLAYQLCDSLQAFFSTIISLLASRALLQGLGVGDASSSTTFAVFLTILKDAMSRIATVIFAYKFGLRIEPEAKRYRFLADVFNDTAFFLELYSPYLGSWGKIVALSTGEALRALCGVAAGASKAALSVHFAKHDNLAELNAKEASQETAVGLFGLLAGSFLVKHIGDKGSVLALTIVLVIAHLLTNYIGVRSVCMKTLNRQRASILFTEYLRAGNVLSPQEVAARENIIFWDPVLRNCNGHSVARARFAESYGDIFDNNGPTDLNPIILDGIMHTKCICSTSRDGWLPCIKIMLWKGAQAQDAIRAWFGVLEMAWAFTADPLVFPTLIAHMKTQRLENAKTSEFAFRASHPYLWKTMVAKGWNLDTQALETTTPRRLDVGGALANTKVQ